uniref:Uncharacterized protein n=1 Tax=viral metagenome TaxID=1070528 RepID=A0A6C0H2W5_9ZZZZ
METTEVEELIDDFCRNDFESDDEEDNLSKKVTDLSRSLDKRINSLEKYYSQNGDNAIEIIRTLSSMYQLSGSKLVEQFLYRICTHGLISPSLKVEAAKCLLDYEEIGDKDRAEEVKINNENRKILGYKALEHVCYNLTAMPAPCRVQAIFLLMNSKASRTNADFYFKEFIKTDSIEVEFRYSSILSLENIGASEMKEELCEYSSEGEILESFFSLLTKWMLPGMKKTKRNCRYILSKLSYEEVKNLYMKIFPERECGRDWFIESSQLEFFFYNKIRIYYRNISGQYLLKNCNLVDKDRIRVENQLIDFAECQDLDYNLRADAADILITFGSESSKDKGRNIIMELGHVNGLVRTVFDNAQNVHTEKVEESVSEILEFLNTFPVYTLDKNPIDFDYVNSRIEIILKDDLNNLLKSRNSGKVCKYCESIITDQSNEEDFCSIDCLKLYTKAEKIRVAMRRICMDRALYSKFNVSLSNILLKVYTYIIKQEDETPRKEMQKRMCEELEEMSGTCSSGFAARLVNIISGFGDYNIRISYEDQIVANFFGRLNALARKITEKDSVFRNKRLEDLVELWLNREDNVEQKMSIENKLNPSEEIEKKPKSRELVIEFLSENRDEKIEQCVQDFAESVLNEMSITSSKYYERRNFGLFFRTHVSDIREELSGEFKDIVTTSEFDLAFRKAIMVYDGEGGSKMYKHSDVFTCF